MGELTPRRKLKGSFILICHTMHAWPALSSAMSTPAPAESATKQLAPATQQEPAHLLPHLPTCPLHSAHPFPLFTCPPPTTPFPCPFTFPRLPLDYLHKLITKRWHSPNVRNWQQQHQQRWNWISGGSAPLPPLPTYSLSPLPLPYVCGLC